MSLTALDHTHDPNLRSWVQDANGHADFPIQNLPLGIFQTTDGDARGGIAIGDHIVDLCKLRDSGLLSEEAQTACAGPMLNEFLSLGSASRVALRHSVSALLAEGAAERFDLLHRASDCTLLLPTRIPNYTDFYAGIHHAMNVGKLFRPDNPLLPNYMYVPIGYHGRASSVRASGVIVRRPRGQRKLADESAPSFGPVRNLDYELELGVWIGGGNELGEPVKIEDARDHIAGYCLLNDWSARDMQTWESQPLGPFLAKSFQTTVSCWIVTPEALAPFRRPQPARGENDPKPMPYLYNDADQQDGALDIELEVLLLTATMRDRSLAPQRLAKSNALHLYWTPQQLLTHHTSNGCNLVPGDLLGSGTISSPTRDGCGSMLELTLGGQQPFTLDSGERRRFLEDGDEVILRARAERDGFASIGFGECRAVVVPAS